MPNPASLIIDNAVIAVVGWEIDPPNDEVPVPLSDPEIAAALRSSRIASALRRVAEQSPRLPEAGEPQSAQNPFDVQGPFFPAQGTPWEQIPWTQYLSMLREYNILRDNMISSLNNGSRPPVAVQQRYLELNARLTTIEAQILEINRLQQGAIPLEIQNVLERSVMGRVRAMSVWATLMEIEGIPLGTELNNVSNLRRAVQRGIYLDLIVLEDIPAVIQINIPNLVTDRPLIADVIARAQGRMTWNEISWLYSAQLPANQRVNFALGPEVIGQVIEPSLTALINGGHLAITDVPYEFRINSNLQVSGDPGGVTFDFAIMERRLVSEALFRFRTNPQSEAMLRNMYGPPRGGYTYWWQYWTLWYSSGIIPSPAEINIANVTPPELVGSIPAQLPQQPSAIRNSFFAVRNPQGRYTIYRLTTTGQAQTAGIMGIRPATIPVFEAPDTFNLPGISRLIPQPPPFTGIVPTDQFAEGTIILEIVRNVNGQIVESLIVKMGRPNPGGIQSRQVLGRVTGPAQPGRWVVPIEPQPIRTGNPSTSSRSGGAVLSAAFNTVWPGILAQLQQQQYIAQLESGLTWTAMQRRAAYAPGNLLYELSGADGLIERDLLGIVPNEITAGIDPESIRALIHSLNQSRARVRQTNRSLCTIAGLRVQYYRYIETPNVSAEQVFPALGLFVGSTITVLSVEENPPTAVNQLDFSRIYNYCGAVADASGMTIIDILLNMQYDQGRMARGDTVIGIFFTCPVYLALILRSETIAIRWFAVKAARHALYVTFTDDNQKAALLRAWYKIIMCISQSTLASGHQLYVPSLDGVAFCVRQAGRGDLTFGDCTFNPGTFDFQGLVDNQFAYWSRKWAVNYLMKCYMDLLILQFAVEVTLEGYNGRVQGFGQLLNYASLLASTSTIQKALNTILDTIDAMSYGLFTESMVYYTVTNGENTVRQLDRLGLILNNVIVQASELIKMAPEELTLFLKEDFDSVSELLLPRAMLRTITSQVRTDWTMQEFLDSRQDYSIDDVYHWLQRNLARDNTGALTVGPSASSPEPYEPITHGLGGYILTGPPSAIASYIALRRSGGVPIPPDDDEPDFDDPNEDSPPNTGDIPVGWYPVSIPPDNPIEPPNIGGFIFNQPQDNPFVPPLEIPIDIDGTGGSEIPQEIPPLIDIIGYFPGEDPLAGFNPFQNPFEWPNGPDPTTFEPGQDVGIDPYYIPISSGTTNIAGFPGPNTGSIINGGHGSPIISLGIPSNIGQGIVTGTPTGSNPFDIPRITIPPLFPILGLPDPPLMGPPDPPFINGNISIPPNTVFITKGPKQKAGGGFQFIKYGLISIKLNSGVHSYVQDNNFIMNESNSDFSVSLRLIKADFTISPTMVKADITEANFSGYLPRTNQQWHSLSGVQDSQQLTTSIDPQHFTHNGGPIANYIYGYFLLTDVSDLLFDIVKYDAPILMSIADDEITIIPQIWLMAGPITVDPNL